MEHNGNEFKLYLQLYQKSLVTVVVDANLDVHSPGSDPYDWRRFWKDSGIWPPE